VFDATQREAAQKSAKAYGERLAASGYGAITTEVLDAPEFYYAEDYHQGYFSIGRKLNITGRGCKIAA
jgi:peptide-methionine (S)-S-oxide reductase